MRLWKTLRKASMLIMPLVMAATPAWAAPAPDSSDATMLMFVGEELYVVTVASKKPESPQEAPAIVSVVGRREIEEKGYRTMTDLLSVQPGFFMAESAEVSTPYLRGIRDSAMLLYDGVPVALDLPQNPHPLGRELSLSGVKRVEIVRGPGSVLWGPDAYAGVVNVVPLTGRDSPGAVVKPFAGSHDLKGAFMSWGDYGKKWDLYVSANAVREHAYDEHAFIEGAVGNPPAEVPVPGSIDDSEFLEITANAHVGEWLTLSGRFSEFKKRFTAELFQMPEPGDLTGNLTFDAERSTPVSYLKAKIERDLGDSHFSMTGYYLNIRYDETDAGLSRDHENDVFYGELLCERSLSENASLTLGASFREGQVGGNYTESDIIYGFLDKENTSIFPGTVEDDYTAGLTSVFSQFRHRWKNTDWWAGIRYDDHSRYDKNTISYSFGFNRALTSDWRLKAGFGTAYRSPYPGAAGESDVDGFERSIDPESISTLNLQMTWNPKPGREMSLTLFHSKLSDHITENSFDVLSLPLDVEISGVELSGRMWLNDTVQITASLTATHNDANDISFRNLDFGVIDPITGNVVEKKYSNWTEPFDSGPELIANVGIHWRPNTRFSCSMDALISSGQKYSYDKGEITGKFNNGPVVNVGARIKKFPFKNTTLTIRGLNILDADNDVKGQYGLVKGRPLTLSAQWEIRF